MHLCLKGLNCCLFYDGGSVVVDSLFIVAPIICGGSVFGPYFVMQYLSVLSSFAIFLMGKRKLIALL